MSKNHRDFQWPPIFIVLLVVVVLIALASVGFEIWVWITYWGKPVTEVPWWAWFFIFAWRR